MASRHHSGGSWITPTRRLAIYLRDHFTCVYCARDLHEANRSGVTLDHLLCRDEYAQLDSATQAQFGSVNASHNLVTACKPCNSSRGTRPWQEYADANGRARILARTQQAPNLDLAAAIIAGDVEDPRS